MPPSTSVLRHFERKMNHRQCEATDVSRQKSPDTRTWRGRDLCGPRYHVRNRAMENTIEPVVIRVYHSVILRTALSPKPISTSSDSAAFRRASSSTACLSRSPDSSIGLRYLQEYFLLTESCFLRQEGAGNVTTTNNDHSVTYCIRAPNGRDHARRVG